MIVIVIIVKYQGHNNTEVFLSATTMTYAIWASRNIRYHEDEVIDSGADVPGILRKLDSQFSRIHMRTI